MSEHLIHPIVVAGGSGTRLWPVSRDTMPKQFARLFGDANSTFQDTILRVKGEGFAKPIVITNSDFRFVVAEQLAAIGVEADIVLEPERRDSGPAVAVGAVAVAARDPKGICLVLAADHAIAGDDLFVEDVRTAAEVTALGRLTLIGIPPQWPATGYGYIGRGEPIMDDRAFEVSRFTEKPDADTAERLVSSGYLWNSGNLVFVADAMMVEMSRLAPEMFVAAERSFAFAVRDLDFIRLDATQFAAAPRMSIDYAVVEKSSNVAVVPARFGWSDVGSWDALYDAKKQDRDGNVLEGEVSVLDTRNSLVRSEDILTTVVGLDDVVVVATADAVLVTSRARAADVKPLVEQLRREGRPQAGEHRRIHRPWGWYQRIDIGPRFQVKQICVKPGGVLSLQRHFHRAEHWVVVHGTAEVTIDDTVKLYHENEAAYLPIGCVHRMRNPGRIPLNIVEVQVGSYTGEDDIVRIEDIYARQ
jgi:mannose-1-phosphate guanylyltransferase/mannose-6-phosphate isomerase